MHAVARWTEMPGAQAGADRAAGRRSRRCRARRSAQAFVDNRKARKPLGALVGAIPCDPTTRITALKSAEALLRAGFAR